MSHLLLRQPLFGRLSPNNLSPPGRQTRSHRGPQLRRPTSRSHGCRWAKRVRSLLHPH